MKLLKNHIDARTQTGSVTLEPTEQEDLWHLYNLLRPGDLLRAPAVRRVTKETSSSTSSERVSTTFTIQVRNVDFDPHAAELHVSGRIAEANRFAGLGQHHTLDLELNRHCTITKGGDGLGSSEFNSSKSDDFEGWDSIALQTLRDACDIRNSTSVWAVIMIEGLANICIVTEHQTIFRTRVEKSMSHSKVSTGSSKADKSKDRFYETTLQTLLRHLEFKEMSTAALHDGKSLPPLLIASPGFTAQEFRGHFIDYASRSGDKALSRYARDNIIVAHSSSGQVAALNEVLRQPSVLAKLKDTKYARETMLMERFFDLLREDEGRAWYGPREVEKAVELGAVGRGGGVLLISNSLFRSNDIKERRRWVELVERVGKVEGGEVRVLSSAHESGKKLETLGNIGAILTYPCPQLGDEIEAEQEAAGGGSKGMSNGHARDEEMGDADLIDL